MYPTEDGDAYEPQGDYDPDYVGAFDDDEEFDSLLEDEWDDDEDDSLVFDEDEDYEDDYDDYDGSDLEDWI